MVSTITKLLKNNNLDVLGEEIDKLIASKNHTKLVNAANLLKNNESYNNIILYYLGNIYQALFNINCNIKYSKSATDYFNKFICRTKKDKFCETIRIPALINLGNLHFRNNRILDALECYIKAEKLSKNFLLSTTLKIKVLFFLYNYYNNFEQNLPRYILLYIMTIFNHLENLYGKNLSNLILNENDFENKNAKDMLLEYITNLKESYKIDTFDIFIGSNVINKRNKYYDWCFENNFILNILGINEFNNYFYYDFINLYEIMGDFEKPQFIFDLFNNIIQEFTSARYLLYKYKDIKSKIDSYKLNIRRRVPDKNVQLISEVRDGALFSYDIEMLKTSFLKLFNIFDKVKLCLIVYIQMNDKILNTEHLMKNNNLNDEFLRDNVSMLNEKHFLHTIYNIILEKEKTDNKEISKKIDVETDIDLFVKIRNKLTHGLLKICIDDYFIDSADVFEKTYDSIDGIKCNYYKITFNDFLYNLEELLRYIKNLIFYLSFAINDFEKCRKLNKQSLGTIKLDKYQF